MKHKIAFSYSETVPAQAVPPVATPAAPGTPATPAKVDPPVVGFAPGTWRPDLEPIQLGVNVPAYSLAACHRRTKLYGVLSAQDHPKLADPDGLLAATDVTIGSVDVSAMQDGNAGQPVILQIAGFKRGSAPTPVAFTVVEEIDDTDATATAPPAVAVPATVATS